MKQKYKYKLYISYEGGPMNRLVRLLVKCPDHHDSYLQGYAQTDGTLP